MITAEERMIFQKVLAHNVAEDVLYALEGMEMGGQRADDIAREVGRRFAYDCDYELDITYWENIENLISKVTRNV